MLVTRFENTNQGTASAEEQHPRRMRNSDRIQMNFGSYGIDIIENDKKIRVSNLYSTHDGVKTNRTFAVVAYPGFIEVAFEKEHGAIINGQSIGVVFEHNGWTIDKQHQYFGEIEIPAEDSTNQSLFSGIGTHNPAIHIYSLVVSKNTSSFNYALIAEVHHPDFLQLEDLLAIYDQSSDQHLITDTKVKDFLGIVRAKIRGLKRGQSSSNRNPPG